MPAERFLEVLPVVVGEQAGDARGDSRAPCVPRVLGVALERGQPPARRLDLFCAHRGLEEVGLPLKDAGLTAAGSLHAGGDLLEPARNASRGCPRPSASRPLAAPAYSAITVRRLRAAISSASAACAAEACRPCAASTIASTPRLYASWTVSSVSADSRTDSEAAS